jgi:hypothetical protein
MPTGVGRRRPGRTAREATGRAGASGKDIGETLTRRTLPGWRVSWPSAGTGRSQRRKGAGEIPEGLPDWCGGYPPPEVECEGRSQRRKGAGEIPEGLPDWCGGYPQGG